MSDRDIVERLKPIIKDARETAIRLQAKQVAGRSQYTADVDQAIADDVSAFYATTIESLRAELAARDAALTRIANAFPGWSSERINLLRRIASGSYRDMETE